MPDCFGQTGKLVHAGMKKDILDWILFVLCLRCAYDIIETTFSQDVYHRTIWFRTETIIYEIDVRYFNPFQ